MRSFTHESSRRSTDGDWRSNSRPSDAIAVAVRVGAGIFVADEVLDKAGVLPEADKDGELSEADPESEERLAKIRDWVNTLNLPDLGTGASES